MADLYPHDDLGRPTGYISGTPMMYCKAAADIVDELAKNKDLLERLAKEMEEERRETASLEKKRQEREKSNEE